LNYGGFSNIIAWVAPLTNVISRVTVRPWDGGVEGRWAILRGIRKIVPSGKAMTVGG